MSLTMTQRLERSAEPLLIQRESLLSAIAAGGGFLAACTLVLPFFEVAGRSRSSIDLISSAGALDVIDGGIRVVVVGLWLVVPILAAGSLIAFAARRPVLAAMLILAVAVLMLAVLVVGIVAPAVSLAWGAWVAAASSSVAAGAAVALMTAMKASETGD